MIILEEETQETEKVEDLDLNNNETDQADGDIVVRIGFLVFVIYFRILKQYQN